MTETASFALRTEHPLAAYLEPSRVLDFDHPSIQVWLGSVARGGRDDVDLARAIYHFVRDEVAHSYDVGARLVTVTASEALRHRQGICYAKAHLLAALLRGSGIPAGIAYQRLALGNGSHCIHALNTVYLEPLGRWIRVDARGNKPGVDAQFVLDGERLAFQPQPELGERDLPLNYPQPHPRTIAVLEGSDDAIAMCDRALPTDL